MKPDEKKFLHDLMSPLAGMSMLVETLEEDLPLNQEYESVHERLRVLSQGLERLRAAVLARREESETDHD